MKVDQLKAGSFLSYVKIALTVLVNLLYTPAMIRYLGQSEYGLYMTVTSIISMFSILSLGFNNGYIRYYTKYKLNSETEKIYKLNGLFLVIFILIGIVVAICGTFLTFNLDIVFSEGLTAKEYEIARWLMLLLTINISLSFPMSVFSTIISANERFVILKSLSILKTVGGPILSLPLLLLGFKSIALVCVTLLIAFTTDIIYLFYVLGVLKNKFIFKGFEKGIFGGLVVYTSFIALNSIVDQINSNIGKLLLGRYKGTAEVSVYSVGYTIYTCYMMFSTAVAGIFTPRIHKLVNGTEKQQLRTVLTDLFVKVGRLQFIIIGLVLSGFAFFGKPFVNIWAGEGYEDSYFVALSLMFASSVPLMQNLGIEIQRAQNKHKFRSIVYIFMAFINFVTTVFLAQKYGAKGTAIGTVVSLIVANGLIMNIYYHKKCNIDIIRFWKSIIRLSLSMVVPVVSGFIMVKCFEIVSIIEMAIGITVYTLIYCLSVWFMGMNKFEKDLIKSFFGRFIRRKNA